MQVYLRSDRKSHLREKINLGLNKVFIKKAFQFIQQGFYTDVQIVKSQKRKAFWLLKLIFMELEALYIEKITG